MRAVRYGAARDVNLHSAIQSIPKAHFRREGVVSAAPPSTTVIEGPQKLRPSGMIHGE